MGRLPLSNELSDLHAAVGDWLYYALLAGATATALFFLVVILFPLKDLFHVLITNPRERRALQTAAKWYEPLWLGLLHPNDEAMAGLKATLIRAPDLVLRQRRGLAALLFAPLKPFARPVDEFAWSTLMKNAQGDDIADEVVRRIATAPEPFTRGPSPLPADAIASITARADAASATVLTRLRDRIGALSDQADVAALIGIMSGTYDEDSLIHTSMFDEPAVCDMIVAHIEAPRATEPATAPSIRAASPPRALIRAKAATALALVAIVAVLASATYRILIYPETNLAAAEAILARFDDPAYQGLANDQAPGKAILRAHRLGVPFERAMAAAENLRDVQTRSQVYQLMLRELALTGRTSDLTSMLTTQSTAPYRTVDHLAVGMASALDVLARSQKPSPAAAQMLQDVARQVNQSFTGELQRSLLKRIVPIAVALENPDAANWMKGIGETDPDCRTWDSIVAEAAALISKPQQAVLLNSIITACAAKTGADKQRIEDKQRMLRRIAVGALQSCDLAGPLMKEVSTHRAGKDAPVPPRFVECLLNEKHKDTKALVVEAHRLLVQTSETAEIRQIWQMSQLLKAGGFPEEARQWAEKAVRFATEPDKQEEKERDMARQFNNDVLKLQILAATDLAKYKAFFLQLAEGVGRAHGGSQNALPDIWAGLRYTYALQADRSCIIKEADLSLVQIQITLREPRALAIAPIILSLTDRCTIEINDKLLAEVTDIVSGINVSTERARYISMAAPYQKNLRKAMAAAETAALPSDILKGYVASIDRHRPSKSKQTESGYNPIQYNPLSTSTAEMRQ